MTARYHLSFSGFLSNLGGNSIHIGLTLLGECLAHQCLLSVLVLEAHLANKLGALESYDHSSKESLDAARKRRALSYQMYSKMINSHGRR